MPTRQELVQELIRYFLASEITIHGARGVDPYAVPPSIRNDGFGDQRPRVPDVIGLDSRLRRIVFGIVRMRKEELDSESSLTDYNVFLDHKQGAGEQASRLVVLLPAGLEASFTDILTHNIHREYWHRVTAVSSCLMKA
jgi:hypothetical protein